MQTTKILVSYHKKAELLNDDIFIPIHVGRSIAANTQDKQWLCENMIGDDTGDNISIQNKKYGELTAQYFAWKNPDKIGNPEYVGFMHYRRHMNFYPEKVLDESIYGLVERSYIGKEYKEEFGLDGNTISNLVKEYDIVVAKQWNVKNDGGKNNYDLYAQKNKILDIKNYDLALNILLKKYPEFQKAVSDYNNNPMGYYTNIFIMKKELFNKYSAWLFSILFECDKETKIEFDRELGHISERLFGIYLTYLKMTSSNLKVKELQRTFVRSTEIANHIPIAFSSDNNYVEHLGCTIASILKNKKPNDYLHFYILNDGLTRKSKKKIYKLQKIEKCEITFVPVSNNDFKDCPLTKVCPHISIATYYRFILADLFSYLDKLLYLDCDITVKGSLFPLYNTDIQDYYFAGVKDVLYDDSAERLNVNKYCNAGVMLINLKRWRDENIQEKLFDYAHKNKDHIVWQDQDVLNVVLQDGIKYVEPIWNAQVGEYDCCYESGFNQIGQNAIIVHHIGVLKPWKKKSQSPYKNLYIDNLKYTKWKYKIPFYILQSIDFKISKLRKKLITIRWNKKEKKISLFGKTILSLGRQKKSTSTFNNQNFLDFVTNYNLDLIRNSGLWDVSWYLKEYNYREDKFLALRNWAYERWERGESPSKYFNVPYYQNTYDIKDENPLLHYLTKGRYWCFYPNDNNAFSDEIDENKIKEYVEYSKTRKANSVMYTCITNNYDDLNAIRAYKYFDWDWDYVCYTDNQEHIEKGQIGIWKIRPLAFTESDNTRINRWHKTHPHLLFPEYHESFYVDANINILTSKIFDIVKQESKTLMLPEHFNVNCSYLEAKVMLEKNLHDTDKIKDMVYEMRKNHFPANYGLTENNVIYRKHNDPQIIAIMEDWWNYIENYSKRDQLSFEYVLFKHGIKVSDVSFENIRIDIKNFYVYDHKKRRCN